MFKICPNCGHHNTVDAKFCVKCGFNLTNVTAIDSTVAAASASTASTTAQSETNAGDTSNSAAPTTATSQSIQATPSAANQPVQQTVQQTYQQPQPAQPNPTLDIAKQYSSNYFSTLLASWKQPLDADQITGSETKYFGYVTLALIAFVATLDMWAVVSNTADLISSLLSSFSSAMSSIGGSSDYVNAQLIATYLATKTSGLYLQFFVYVLIILAIFAVVGFVTRRVFIGDSAITFNTYTNRFAFRASGTIPILLLTLLIIWLGGGLFSILLISLLLAIYQVQLNVALFITSNEAPQLGKIDRVYSLVIMQVLANIASSILMISWINGVIRRLAA